MNVYLQRLQYLARRYPFAFFSVLLALVLTGADYYLWKRSRTQSDNADRVRQEGETMLLSISSQPRIHALTTAMKEGLATIDANLAIESDLAGNLDYFYQIEKVAKIRLTGISQLTSPPAPADAPYRAVPFSLRLTGTYQQVLTYLHALETGPRSLRVRHYRFSQSDPSADALSLDLTVEVLGRP